MRGRVSGFGRGLDGSVIALVKMALAGPPPFLEKGAIFFHFVFVEGERPMPNFRGELRGLTEEADYGVGDAVGTRCRSWSVPTGKNQWFILKHIGRAYLDKNSLPRMAYIMNISIARLVSLAKAFDGGLVSHLEKLIVMCFWVCSLLYLVKVTLQKLLFFRG